MAKCLAFLLLNSMVVNGALIFARTGFLLSSYRLMRRVENPYSPVHFQSMPIFNRRSTNEIRHGKARHVSKIRSNNLGQHSTGQLAHDIGKTIKGFSNKLKEPNFNVNMNGDQGYNSVPRPCTSYHVSVQDGLDVKRNEVGPAIFLETGVSCNVTNGLANCSNRHLVKVPTDLSHHIWSLDLSYNSLGNGSLLGDDFAKYSNLKFLNLTGNKITRLHEGVFHCLSKLQYLNLWWNRIKMDQKLNKSNVFEPLAGSLKTLMLHGNHKNTSDPELLYPEYALSWLENLMELHLDGLMNKTFGKGFAKLKNLKKLSVAGFYPGFCNLTTLTKHTFENVGVITDLNISDCKLNKHLLDDNAFRPLTNLNSLDISNNFGLSLECVGKLMFGLKNNKNFKHLKMKRIGARFAPCVIVLKDHLKNFQNMSLEILEAEDNGIETIQLGAIKMLPQTLGKVNLKNNKIMFGAYLRDLNSLQNLSELNLDSSFNQAEAFPSSLPSPNLDCQEERMTKKPTILYEHNVFTPKRLLLSLPHFLQNLSMKYSSIVYNIGHLEFSKNNSLQAAYLQGNVFKALRGPVIGLIHLKILDLSDCYIETIENKFLRHFPSLEYLNLYQNLLGETVNNDRAGKIFLKIENLRHLNMSFNNIYYISRPFFSYCRKLETIDLSTNRLHDIVFNISKMPNLTYLNLSGNSVHRLRESAMAHIDTILNSNRTFTLDLRFNPIACDCSNLRFVKWLAEREQRIHLGNISEYVCILVDSTRMDMHSGYGDIVRLLQRQCESHQLLFFFVGGGTTVFLLILVSSIAYRYRWSLRYWYYTVKLMASSKQENRNDDFDYDAFICYEHADEDFVVQTMVPELTTKRGVRLMIHGQSFHAGRLIIDNIIMAVKRCQKTIVLVTKSMLNSKWCLYELQMARMEAIDTGRNVLIFLFLENIAYKDIKLDIVSYIKSNVVTGYPPNPRQRKVFWDKLAHDIKRY